MNKIATGVFALILTVNLAAVSSAGAQTSSPPIKGMASTVGLYVYPKSGQSASKQLTDESQCYSNAKTQTGYDPNATTTAAAPKKDDQKSGDKSVAQGAARGAVISGATGGDPAAGARRGAILGGIKAKRKEKQDGRSQDDDPATPRQLQTLTLRLPGRSRLFSQMTPGNS
jgi:hypothetical protein